jgi:uncharacterized SAM-dependent methyltransferase
VWYSENHNVTSITFGERYNEKVEIMRYSHRDSSYKVTLPIDVTDEQLEELIELVQSEYKQVKIDYLESELFILKGSKVVV